MIKACIFDLDGTLLNTLEDLTDAVNFSLEKNNFPLRSIEEVRRFVGNGVATLMDRAVPQGTSSDEIQACLSDFKSYYSLHKQDKTCPYPGISDLLSRLYESGIKLAIVSNKFDRAVKELAEFYFPGLISVAIGESDRIRKKPAAYTVYEALSLLEADKSEVIYVGDSETDIETAANAGVRHIGVTWGFRDRDTLKRHGASDLIDAPLELMEYIS